ncbi:MAG TPA: PepSY domain-containing protein [Terriglobales bacterium]|nr:PepSY domain-containing protein [Terriglobales bacterium]
MRFATFTKIAIGLIATATIASADTAAGNHSSLSPAQIASKLEAAGYTNVHDIEYDGTHWEAEATSSAGKPVDLEIDGQSGAVTREEAD